MNRTEFMRQLEGLLWEISPKEREEALQYYNDYFDDAGPEKEGEVLEALGTPDRVAENIKREILGTSEHTVGVETQRAFPAPDRALVRYQQAADHGNEETASASGKNKHTLLRILAAPFVLLLGLIVSCVGLVLFMTLFGLILGFGITVLALFFSALVLGVTGIMCAPFSGLTCLALFGGGMVCAGIGVLFLMVTVALAGIVTPATGKGLTQLWTHLFHPSTAAQ